VRGKEEEVWGVLEVAAWRWSRLGDSRPRWHPEFLDGATFGPQRKEDRGGIGCGVGRGCSQCPFIG
jgi:hypothetical protein